MSAAGEQAGEAIAGTAAPPPAGISREDLENAISETRLVDPATNEARTEADRLVVEIEGRQRFFGLRTRWSSAIIVWISLLILFNCVLAILVGAGTLHFENYQWFITAVTVETFLQVIALGAIAVRFLFSSGDTPPSA